MNNHKHDELSAKSTQEHDERTPRNSFRKLLKEFASTTSFGGLSNIASSRGIVRRVLWTLISATCYGFTIYMTIGLVTNYTSKPISTTIDIAYEKNIEFPAITMCNLNKFRRSEISTLGDIAELIKEYKSKNKSSKYKDNFKRQTSSLKKDASLNSDTEDDEKDVDDDEISEQSILEQMISLQASYTELDYLVQVGHQLETLLYACSWMGVDCKNGYFAKYWTHSWNWRYGNCYTFNPGVNQKGNSLSVVRTSMPGPNYGLTLDLNIEQDEYVDALTDEAGVKVVIHNPKQMPFPYDEGVTVPPGFSTSIGLRKEIVQRVDPFKNNSCEATKYIATANIYSKHYNGARMKYSVKACMKSCLAKEQILTCNCSSVSFSKLSKMCDDDEGFDCLATVNTRYKNNDIGCSKKCPQPCFQESYSHSYMMSALSVNKKKDAKEGFGKNKTDADVDDNFLRIRIFYEKLNLQKITQSVYYSLEVLLGDIGGQLGLWIGISAISIAEFGELVISLFILAFRKSRGHKKTSGVELKQNPSTRNHAF